MAGDEFECTFSAPPVEPTQVRNVTITNPQFSVVGNSDLFNFTVMWVPPEFSNGELQEYQIRVIQSGMPDAESVLPQQVMVRLNTCMYTSFDLHMFNHFSLNCSALTYLYHSSRRKW